MSEYEGPVFKSKNQRPVSQRRFNRVNQQNPFQKSRQSTSQVSTNDTEHYELPNKTKSLSTRSELSNPVDSQTLSKNLERVKQKEVKVSEYEVPFLKQTKEQKQHWEDMQNRSIVETKEYITQKSNKTSHYQPAFNPAPTVLAEDDQEPIIQSPVKSIEDRQVRTIATRLVKDKSSYLLFEESKEKN